MKLLRAPIPNKTTVRLVSLMLVQFPADALKNKISVIYR